MAPTPKPLYGVVHVPPLPGTPFHRSGSFPGIVKDVRAQARRMVEGGMDGLLLQTVDRVYSVRDDSDPARVAAMSVLAHEVLGQSPAGFAVGVQIMRHAVSASLAVAKVTGATFVRADALVGGATLTTHGWVEPDSLQIMTYRKAIEAMGVDLIVDVDSMHYRWAGPDETTGGGGEAGGDGRRRCGLRRTPRQGRSPAEGRRRAPSSARCARHSRRFRKPRERRRPAGRDGRRFRQRLPDGPGKPAPSRPRPHPPTGRDRARHRMSRYSIEELEP